MGVILIFKSESGEELLCLNKPKTPEQERLFSNAPKLKIHDTIKFNFGTRSLGYRIVKIDRAVASPKAFGLKESIMKLEFTLKLIEKSQESA